MKKAEILDMMNGRCPVQRLKGDKTNVFAKWIRAVIIVVHKAIEANTTNNRTMNQGCFGNEFVTGEKYRS